MTRPLVQLSNVSVHFRVGGRRLVAVDGVSLAIERGEALGLVGESGSGKSTTGKAMLRLVDIHAGAVAFDGRDITASKERALRDVRRRMQPVFQDPRASLNPRMTVAQSLREPLVVHKIAGDHRAIVNRLAERVSIPASALDRYPHAFSGGQLQRIAVARAMACEPALLVLDEPISALDVSVGAQLLNLFGDLRDEDGLSYLFIAHDLHAVAHLCDRVAVMYLGRIVEQGPAAEILDRPLHPYTDALVASVPGAASSSDRSKKIIPGEPPSPLDPPPGCAFHPRCPLAEQRCRNERPQLRASADRFVACHLVKN